LSSEGRVYVGDAEGDLFALDAQTGCIHWTIEVEAGIRSAIIIGKRGAGGLAAYFGDHRPTCMPWTRIGEDPMEGQGGRLFTGRHHGSASVVCRAFVRADFIARRISSGRSDISMLQVPGERGGPRRRDRQTNLEDLYDSRGGDPHAEEPGRDTALGPSGAAVWNAPVIDVKRNLLYIGTGNNYSPPAIGASDSMLPWT